MYRSILVALLAGVMLVALAMPLPMLPNSIATSGSALAQKDPTSNAINLNSSRSNNYRDGAPSVTTGTPKQGKGNSPKGTSGDAARATTVKSSKSNTSD